MRGCSLDTKKHCFDLSWKYVYAANDDHVIGSAFDLADTRTCSAAFAGGIVDGDNVACAVADERDSTLCEGRYDQLAILAGSDFFACKRIDDLRVEDVGVNVQAAFICAFLRDARADDLAETINISGEYIPCFFDLVTHSFAPGFGTEYADLPCALARIEADLCRFFSHIHGIAWRTSDYAGLEILHEL